MDILKRFRKKKPLSADVIALLAQAHQIHQAELEFARDEAREAARTELRQKVRDALSSIILYDDNKSGTCTRSAADIQDRYLYLIGSLFCETPEHQADWSAYVRERRIAMNDRTFEALHSRIIKSRDAHSR